MSVLICPTLKKVLWIRGSRAGENRLDFSVNLFRRLWGDRLTGIRRGLTARMVVVIDAGGTVRHVELVKEVSTEPDYLAALAVL